MNKVGLDSSIERDTGNCCPLCDSTDLDRVPKTGKEKTINLIWPHRVFHCYHCNNRVKLFDGGFVNARFLVISTIFLVLGFLLITGMRIMVTLLSSREPYPPLIVKESMDTDLNNARVNNAQGQPEIDSSSTALQSESEAATHSSGFIVGTEPQLNGVKEEADLQHTVQNLNDQIQAQKLLIAEPTKRIHDRDFGHYETFNFSIFSAPVIVPTKKRGLNAALQLKKIAWNQSDSYRHETFRLSIDSNYDLLHKNDQALKRTRNSEKFAQQEAQFNARGK